MTSQLLLIDSDVTASSPFRRGALIDSIRQSLLDMGSSTQEATDYAPVFADAIFKVGLEVADRGRIADLKANISDWLRLAADNAACGEESVDFESVQTTARRLIGGGL